MAALGYKMVLEIEGVVVLEIEGVVIGYGTSVHDMFEIRQFDEKSALSEHIHLAFNAYSKEDVDAFYYKVLANGGKCNGEPGFRPQYEDGYYSAFVIDPDGHNIEAVYSEKAKVPPIVTSSNCLK